MPKKKLNKHQEETLKENVKEFNGIAKSLIRLLGIKVQEKERKINIMVSRIRKPGKQDRHIDVTTMDIGKNFEAKQRQKKRKKGSEWNSNFSERKGYII